MEKYHLNSQEEVRRSSKNSYFELFWIVKSYYFEFEFILAWTIKELFILI